MQIACILQFQVISKTFKNTIFAIIAIKCTTRCRSLLFTTIAERVYAAATCNIAL